MIQEFFSDADRRQMESLGIREDQVLYHLELFNRPSVHLRLCRPSTLGDGIQGIPDNKVDLCLNLHRRAASEGRFEKFIPASGAATRMFQSLIQMYYVPQYLECDELYLRVEQGVSIACDFLRFLDGLRCFAFREDLEEVLARDGWSLGNLAQRGHFRLILEYLLLERGLDYATLPKALLKFHRYPDGRRTAFEEHLIEAAQYAFAENGACRLHFTVSPEHESRFQALLEAVRHRYEDHLGVRLQVGFSHQKPNTNTIAVDGANVPFRERNGRLLFRPGGHGALIENLNDVGGDLVYIKNIDNLVPDHLKTTTGHWKKILGGLLVELQDRQHGFLRRLEATTEEMVLEEAERFARNELLITLPRDFAQWPPDRKRVHLFEKLHRPMRVCGVVPNSGEPGGAPFWVEDKDGLPSLQIVEKAQVNLADPEQEKIWMSSTHFNPVDLVCALRDHRGKSFELHRHVDPEAVFISRKSKDGRELKALELPGLWNGSMSDWITVFVEVPLTTFNPVKTVFDLLRPEHLSQGC